MKRTRTKWDGPSPYRTKEYRSWEAAKRRCFNQNDPKFPRYGGRGITMCDRWRNSPAAFLADMGPCPLGHTLNRKDNDGNYEPSNCNWATPSEQRRNQERGGTKLNIVQAAEIRRRGAHKRGDQASLAREYKVSPATICEILSHKTWSEAIWGAKLSA